MKPEKIDEVRAYQAFFEKSLETMECKQPGKELKSVNEKMKNK